MKDVVAAPTPGRILAGRYALEKEIGRGGMGAVWLGHQTTLGSKVAIKVLRSELHSKELERRFLSEARAAARLNSPHIVRLFDYGVDEGLAFCVMELLEGQNLGELLVRTGTVPSEVVGEILGQVCRGLQKAHDAGIVHRDLKPDNIFLVDNDTHILAKILDFGIAKVLGAATNSMAVQTESGMLLGTVHYMSPEQLNDPKSVTTASDVWSLGVIAFECLLGQRPFEGATLGALAMSIAERPLPVPSELGPVPAGFDAWFSQTVNRDPRERFHSVRALASALSACCDPSRASGASRGVDIKPRLTANVPTGGPGGTQRTLVNTASNATGAAVSKPSSLARSTALSRTPLAAVLAATATVGLAVASTWYYAAQRAPQPDEIGAATEAVPQPPTREPNTEVVEQRDRMRSKPEPPQQPTVNAGAPATTSTLGSAPPAPVASRPRSVPLSSAAPAAPAGKPRSAVRRTLGPPLSLPASTTAKPNPTPPPPETHEPRDTPPLFL